MSSDDKVAVFILTNGRPDNVITFHTLRRLGYTGAIYLIVDNLDKTKDEYIKRYGANVVVFDKEETAKAVDSGDNFHNLRSILYARNASFKIAKDLGIKYFMQLDDDYTAFNFRYGSKLTYLTRHPTIKDLDRAFACLLEFYKSTSIHSIALVQGGDFIGGKSGPYAQNIQLLRKCMNSFLCSTERPFKFIGILNDDVNTYVRWGSTGTIMLSTNQIGLEQKRTQTKQLIQQRECQGRPSERKGRKRWEKTPESAAIL